MSFLSKKQFQGYDLKSFDHILEAISAQFHEFPDLVNRTILELGPGSNTQLLRFLKDQSHSSSIQGIGLTRPTFWKREKQSEDEDIILQSLILPALQVKDANSHDLIISKHVLEQHSIEAAILLKDPNFKQAIRDNRFSDLPKSFPASVKNIQAIFAECYRILKPGGVIITQVAKKKYRVLIPEGLQAFNPKQLTFKDIGRFSEISIFVK